MPEHPRARIVYPFLQRVLAAKKYELAMTKLSLRVMEGDADVKEIYEILRGAEEELHVAEKKANHNLAGALYRVHKALAGDAEISEYDVEQFFERLRQRSRQEAAAEKAKEKSNRV